MDCLTYYILVQLLQTINFGEVLKAQLQCYASIQFVNVLTAGAGGTGEGEEVGGGREGGD